MMITVNELSKWLTKFPGTHLVSAYSDDDVEIVAMYDGKRLLGYKNTSTGIEAGLEELQESEPK